MGNPPDPPNYGAIQQQANQTAQQQQGFNLQSWLSSLIGQEGPWGSLKYEQTGTGPGGTPLMKAVTQYTPGIQNLFDQLVSFKDKASDAGTALMNGAQYGAQTVGDAVGNLTSGITGGIMDNYKSYLDPFFQTAKDRLHTQLSNRGLVPGQPAYDSAMRELDTNQGLTVNNLIGQVGTKAYELAQGLYKMPWELASQMAQFGAPASANQDFTGNTPSLQPANLVGATANTSQAMNDIWKAQTQKYGDLWGGVGQIGGSLLGGWASSPSGGAALSSMFALSDEDYKTDIVPTGGNINGIPLYEFRYKWSPDRQVGVMAHDVAEVIPDAVVDVGGVKYVDYSKVLTQ